MNIDPNDSPLAPQSVRFLRSFVLAVILITFGAAMGYCDQPQTQSTVGAQTLLVREPIHKPGWMVTWQEATEAAKKSGKPILLVFTGNDWCHWCQQLQEEVLQTAKFDRWSDRVVKIEIDFPSTFQLPRTAAAQNKVLADWYQDFVDSYPTALFIEPDGRVIGTVGYVQGGPDEWINRANGVLLTTGDLQASLGVRLR